MRKWIAIPLLMVAQAGAAQQTRLIRGTVLTPAGEPVRGANVFVMATLDGAVSDSLGGFAFSTRASIGDSLLVQRIGMRELRLTLDAADLLQIVLFPEPVPLPALQVRAGRFQAGNAPDAELTTLQVVSTPGAAADVYRALQTFPGLQSVDEGAGLFVRGGDIAETRVFLNDAIVLSPYRYESPTGGFFGAFDPFLLDGIYFSSGGFGARYGDALSGVAALRTVGKPDRASLGATASLAALSASATLPVGSRLGARATLTRSHTELLFRVNGTTTEFTHEPEGRDASVIGSFVYDQGEVRLFAIDQWSQLGVFLEEPSFADALDAHAVHAAQLLSWQHAIGKVSLYTVAGQASAENTITFGSFELKSNDRLRQLRAHAQFLVSALFAITLGAERLNRRAAFAGRTPQQSHDGGPAAPTDAIASRIDDDHSAGFLEIDWTALSSLRVVAGVRSDRSRLADSRSWDPRASAALKLGDHATLTGAWGIYHQVPAPALHDADFGGAALGPMRAEHRIIGLQLGEGDMLLRLEAYEKHYNDLADWTRDRNVVAGGTGQSRGIDLFARWPGLLGVRGRTSYSFIHARRTDPSTGTLARSPFDITHVMTSVLERNLGPNWQLSMAHRSASGRPFTPVVAAQHDPVRGLWVPGYGPPNSERLPRFERLDLSVSRLFPLPRQRLLVLFGAVNNLLDRKNVHDYRYNATYTERIPVRSQFKRSFYVGATATF